MVLRLVLGYVVLLAAGVSVTWWLARRYGGWSWRTVGFAAVFGVVALAVGVAVGWVVVLVTTLDRAERRANAIHGLPVIEGVVVEEGTGEPVAGVEVGRWPWRARAECEGTVEYARPSLVARVETDAAGRFRLEGVEGEWSAIGVYVVWREGDAKALRVYPAGGGGWLVKPATTFLGSAPAWAEVRPTARGDVVLRLRVRRAGSPEEWAEYLGGLAWLSEEVDLVPNDLLLDEAYRYVSQGGKVTEGIARVFFDSLMPCGESPRWGNSKTLAISRSILEYCNAHREERLCQSYSVKWARQHQKAIFSNTREEGR